MKFRADTILAAFVVGLFSSFLTALGVLLVRTIAISVFRSSLLADFVLNIYILFFLAGFIFFKGSSTAAWLLYRHELAWGYKVEFKRIIPIFILSFLMAMAVFSSLYAYFTAEYNFLAFFHKAPQAIEEIKRL